MFSSRALELQHIWRSAVAILAGFGGRLVARVLIVATAAQLYGTTAFGRLGETIALIELLAVFAALGFKRTLHAQLEVANNNDEQRTVIWNALFLAAFNGIVLALLLLAGWLALAGPDWHFSPVLLLGISLLAITDVALAVTRFQGKIIWDVIARGLCKPWSLLLLIVFGSWFQLRFPSGETLSLIDAYAISLWLTAIVAIIGLVQSLPRTGSSNKAASTKYQINCRQLWRMQRINMSAGMADTGAFSFRKLDILAVGAFAPPEVTGVYYMAQQLATVAEKVRYLFEPMVAPALAKTLQAGDANQSSFLIYTVVRWTFSLQLLVLAIYIVIGAPLLGLFHPDFIIGASVLVILVIGEVFDGSSSPFETTLLYVRPGIPVRVIAAIVALEFLLLYLLVPMMGASGAAIGFTLAMLCLAIIRYLCQLRLTSLPALFLPIGKPLFVFCVTLLMGFVISSHEYFTNGLSSPWQIIFQVMLMLMIYLGVTRLLGMAADSDQQLFRQLRNKD